MFLVLYYLLFSNLFGLIVFDVHIIQLNILLVFKYNTVLLFSWVLNPVYNYFSPCTFLSLSECVAVVCVWVVFGVLFRDSLTCNIYGEGAWPVCGYWDWFCLRRKVCNGCWLQVPLGKGSRKGLEGDVQGAKGLHGLGNEIWLGCLISVKSLAPSRTGHKWKTH